MKKRDSVAQTAGRKGIWPLRKRNRRVTEKATVQPQPSMDSVQDETGALHETLAPGMEAVADVLYAPPQLVTDLAECHFYHTMDIPGYGHVEGEWDLRAGVDAYLGGVDFAGKRVLEMGVASGFLTVAMESRGASVVAYDLSPEQSWDVVPMAGLDYTTLVRQRQAHIARINKGFWLNHRAHRSSARIVYGTAYAVPEAIGPVDIATFGAVFPHVRDPFLALQNVLRLTRETIIVTEYIPAGATGYGDGEDTSGHSPYDAMASFLPNVTNKDMLDAWWLLKPETIRRFMGVLGFERTETTYHTQLYQGKPARMYTIVGHRTAGAPLHNDAENAYQRTIAQPTAMPRDVDRDGAPTAPINPAADTSDALPLPPSDLMYRVVGTSDPDWFLATGHMTADDFEAALASIGKRLDDFSHILDFGCGCGRVMRWLRQRVPSARLAGSDIDAPAIAWMHEYMPDIEAHVNGGLPPLPFPDATFDLVVSYSVFSHLDADYQGAWLQELTRVTAPGAILLLTIQGPGSWKTTKRNLTPVVPEIDALDAELERNGFLHWRGDGWEKHFPDFYHSSWHLPDYIRRHWAQWFTVIDALEGKARPEQDLVILTKHAPETENTSK